MHHPMIAAGLALMLAACAGGGGPQDIRIGDAGADPPAVTPGPHTLSTAERAAVRAGLKGASITTVAARRGDDGVVSVCGVLGSGAPFLGILTERGGQPGFSLSGIGQSGPEARAVRKICVERGVTI